MNVSNARKEYQIRLFSNLLSKRLNLQGIENHQYVPPDKEEICLLLERVNALIVFDDNGIRLWVTNAYRHPNCEINLKTYDLKSFKRIEESVLQKYPKMQRRKTIPIQKK